MQTARVQFMSDTRRLGLRNEGVGPLQCSPKAVMGHVGNAFFRNSNNVYA